MNKVAVGGHQLVVVAPHVLPPRKVRVARLRHSGRDHVAQRVRVVAVQVLRQPDGPVSAGGELEPFQVHVLVRRNVVWQVQPAVAQQQRGPDYRVEGYVVLAHEIVRAPVALPEVFPALRLAAVLRPLNGRRQIADDRLEPDVDALAVVALQRQRHAPVDVSRNCAVA